MTRSTKWVVNIFASVVVAVSIIGFISLSSNMVSGTAHAQPATDIGAENDGANTNEETDDDVETDCAINKIGWILCPLIDVSAKIGDQSFNFLAKSFLETEPELVSDQSGTRDAWELARNIANILFIIAFLIVILSQVTGRGLDNYGIKKTLPRLIIAAVAVNVSYYICQALVDITNIMGWEIKDFLLQLAQSVSDRTVFPPQTGPDVQTGNGFLGATAAFVLGAVAFVWFFLPLLIMGVSVVVVTCITIVLVLLLRKAIIILLVVVSPIAFVFYLLPNTEKYFQRWYTMFWKLLLVFPIVAMLFGAGQLASAIIITAGSSSTASDSYRAQVDGEEERCVELPLAEDPLSIDNEARVARCADRTGVPVMLGLVAAGVAVAPLIAVWAVMKGAIGAVGAIGGKVTGAIETYSGKAVKNKGTEWAKNRAKENMAAKWQRYQTAGLEDGASRGQRLAGRFSMRGARRSRDLERAKSELDRAKNFKMAGELADSDPTGLSSAELREQGHAIATVDKLRGEEQQAASLITRDMSVDKLEQITDGEFDVNDPMVAAAIEALGEQQDFKQLEKIMDKIAGNGPGLATRALAQALSKNAGGLITGGQVAAIAQGAYKDTYANTVRGNLEKGVMTEEKMAAANPSIIEEASQMAAGSTKAQNRLSESASKVLADEILNKKVGRIVDDLTSFTYNQAAHKNPRPNPKTGKDDAWNRGKQNPWV